MLMHYTRTSHEILVIPQQETDHPFLGGLAIPRTERRRWQVGKPCRNSKNTVYQHRFSEAHCSATYWLCRNANPEVRPCCTLSSTSIQESAAHECHLGNIHTAGTYPAAGVCFLICLDLGVIPALLHEVEAAHNGGIVPVAGLHSTLHIVTQ